MSLCADILARHPQEWAGAIAHPFLTAVTDGTVTPQQFNAWLVQDGLFVREFTRFLAACLAAAPPAHFDLLLGGAAALRDELRWFQDLTAKRGCSLDVPPAPACSRYIQFMRECSGGSSYAAQACVLWAIEKCYHDAWHNASPGMPAPYHSYAQRWGSLAFGDYVDALAAQADEALTAAGAEERQAAEALVVEVCRLERAFWGMAFEGAATE